MADNHLNMDDFELVYPDSVDPVLSQAFDREVRVPHSYPVAKRNGGLEPALHASQLVSTPFTGTRSLLGHRIAHPVVSPLIDLEDALERLEMEAVGAGNAPLADTGCAQDVLDILLGRTQGRYYDGFAMLTFNQAANASPLTEDHVPGEYKMKALAPTGRTVVSPIDGVERAVWHVTINLLWLRQNFDSDTFLLRVPKGAHPNDTFEITWRIYSTIQEDLAPTTILNDAFGRIFHGLDSTFLSLPPNHLSEITIRYPAIRNVRGIYNWGWGVHPPRIHFLQPVYRVPADNPGGALEIEGDEGWDPVSYSFVRRNRELGFDSIGRAAPEKKAHRVATMALDREPGTSVLAMLTDPNTPPRGRYREWINLAGNQIQLPDEAWDLIKDEPGVDPIDGKIGNYDVVVSFMNNKMYGISAAAQPQTEGKRVTVGDFAQGDVVRAKVINLDNHTHYYRNVDFGAQYVKDMKKVFGNGKFSFEKFSPKPSYGVPKVVEMQWRTGWGYTPHRGIALQGGVFPRARDREALRPFTDQFGKTHIGYQFTHSANGFFRFNPPAPIRAGYGHPQSSVTGPDPLSGLAHEDFGPGEPLRDDDGQDGIKVGQDTEGFGVAKMPLDGPFAHPNDDTKAKLPAQYPGFLRNQPNAAGGDIIPPTDLWRPFLAVHPTGGDLDDPDTGGYWVDKTYLHGRPIYANNAVSANIEAPRASAQLFYNFDPLYHDNGIFSFHPTSDIAR